MVGVSYTSDMAIDTIDFGSGCCKRKLMEFFLLCCDCAMFLTFYVMIVVWLSNVVY